MSVSDHPTEPGENHAQPEQKFHTACLSLGSNIEPRRYLPQAVEMLRQAVQVQAVSDCWESAPIGSGGGNFINLAVALRTTLSPDQLKSGLLTTIENTLDRVRTADKNAARTIDLDIILYDRQVLDPALWQRAYLALTVAELFPDIPHPIDGRALHVVARELSSAQFAIIRPGFLEPTS